MKKILLILTSHEDLDNTDAKTGVWLGEFTDPYYEFMDQGYEVILASPQGGQPPVDPMSKLTEHITASNRRFQDDETAKQQFASTQRLEAIHADDYDAMFIAGGHGPLWDLATSEVSGRLILHFLQQDKPVAAVCHGPAALIKAAVLQPGLLQDKMLTCFTNTEEKLAMKSGQVPYLLEDRLKELGADFDSATIPYTAHVEEDGLLITGQNPMSAGPTAKALVARLQPAAR